MSGPKLSQSDLFDAAHTIAEEYSGNLTLRQLYYQTVARGFSSNSQEAYRRLGELIARARLDGRFPFEWLVDRTRESYPGAFAERKHSVIDAMAEARDAIRHTPFWYLRADRWWGQPLHVSVWVEKEALAGVFEEPCNGLGVSWFVCRGYPSISALWQWVEQLREAV